MFTDREIILKEDSPDGAWSLHIYGPSNADPRRLPPDNPPYYASFMKSSSESITAMPFGEKTDSQKITVKWNETGRMICEVYIEDECYVLFEYGARLVPSRGFFRVAPMSPFSAEDITTMKTREYPEED